MLRWEVKLRGDGCEALGETESVALRIPDPAAEIASPTTIDPARSGPVLALTDLARGTRFHLARSLTPRERI